MAKSPEWKRVVSGIVTLIMTFSCIPVFAQTEQIPPAVPPATSAASGATNYQKCLNIALLTRETVAQTAYQEFNKTIEPERVALEKAAKPFSGWLAWLNVFRRKDVENFNKLNMELEKVIEKATPAKDTAIEKSNSKFTVDQQFCLTHQNATYKWTPENQKTLDQLLPPRSSSDSKTK